jgi:RNA polymerase sigma-54 factor
MVKRLIESENPRLPLDDEAIVTLLARHGVRVSRRTVAKYRGTLHIGSAKERRRPQRGNRTLDNPVTFGASA